MSRFEFFDTPLSGLTLVQRKAAADARGFFSRFFCAEELAPFGFELSIAQINHTLTRRRGSARGLHFQRAPQAEDKLVSCLRGEVFDVAVDLRAGSPTFLRWHSAVLSADNMCSLMIPQGFAHGFQTLTDDCELIYLHSRAYNAASEGGVNLRDPRLAIAWPLPIADLSQRDAQHPELTDNFSGLSP